MTLKINSVAPDFTAQTQNGGDKISRMAWR